MRATRALVFGLAVLAAAMPIIWLAVVTYFGFTNVRHYGWLDGNTAGYVLGSLGCWISLVTSVWFVGRVTNGGSVRQLLPSPKTWLPVLVGVTGDAALYLLLKENPKIAFPLTFFIWPTAAFVVAGLFCAMLPNNTHERDASQAPRPSA